MESCVRSVLTNGQPEAEGLSSAGLARIDGFLESQVAEGELAGAVTLVARHGKIVHRWAIGLKDIATGESLAADTIFRIFSMTKPVTAVAMMILFERGLWSPDDPIARHLPEFAGVKGPGGLAPDHAPTMRELMTHTAGFAYGIGPGPHDEADAGYIAAKIWAADDLADFIRRLAALPLAYQPGTRFRYSLSMDVQGAIIERLSGTSLPDFMRANIFEPLGMVDTDFFVPAEKLPRLATLYHKYGAPVLTPLPPSPFLRDPGVIPSVPNGGGGLYSTADDYARFCQMLLNHGELGGARVLARVSVSMMTKNYLSDAILKSRPLIGAHQFEPGFGYGFNGAVFVDPEAVGSKVGKGTYQWDGAAGTWFWIDPVNETIYVGLIQRMMQDGMAPFQKITQAMIAEAMI
jgi:CubicO group peptidase (beta-lactamase class C family)